MFRFTRKPSSGSHSQLFAKITHLVHCGYVELLQDIISVMAAYYDLWGVLYELYVPQWTKCVILAKYWWWLPDDGFLVNRNMLEQLSYFKMF